MNIFDLPQIVIEKVGLNEILDMLRTRVNKKYMPSANGEICFTTKPEYAVHSLSGFPDFPSIPFAGDFDRGYGSFNAFCTYETTKPADVFFYFQIAKFVIYINLKTDQALITHVDHMVFTKWDNPDDKIPVMRDQLRAVLNLYI